MPTVQLYASNARNTTLNIRGLGSTFGLTNDGIDPGVGFYVNGFIMQDQQLRLWILLILKE